MRVKCPNCKRICHETNDTFNPDERPHGGMVDLLEPWVSYGWGKFGEDSYGGPSVMASDMLCPICQAPLAPSGRLMTIPDEEPVPKPKTLAQRNQELINEFDAEDDEKSEETVLKPFICNECKWLGKTLPSLKRHATMTGHT